VCCGFELSTLNEYPTSQGIGPTGSRVRGAAVRPRPHHPDWPRAVIVGDARVNVDEGRVQSIGHERRRTIYAPAGFWWYLGLHAHYDAAQESLQAL
jgi:hypothetical protein